MKALGYRHVGRRWFFLPMLLVLALAGDCGKPVEKVGDPVSPCPAGATLNIVAHQDDDLLFQSPNLFEDIRAGRCVRTIYLTAGDDNQPEAYWLGREAGAKSAYAKMPAWTTVGDSTAGVRRTCSGHGTRILDSGRHHQAGLVGRNLPTWYAAAGAAQSVSGRRALGRVFYADVAGNDHRWRRQRGA